MRDSLSIRQSWILSFLAGLSFVACSPGPPIPVDIAPEDMCQRCKMVISEKRLAAEFIDQDGLAFKFDDISCMVHVLKNRSDRRPIAAVFVTDFDSGAWIRADEASFIRSDRLKTPMGGGAAAFKDHSKAETAAAGYQGRVMRFDELEKVF